MSIKNFVSTSVTLIHIKMSAPRTFARILSSFTMFQSHFCSLIILISMCVKLKGTWTMWSGSVSMIFSTCTRDPHLYTPTSRERGTICRDLQLVPPKRNTYSGLRLEWTQTVFDLFVIPFSNGPSSAAVYRMSEAILFPGFSFSTKFSNQATKQYPCTMLFSRFPISVLHFELYARSVQFRAKISFERAIFLSFYVRSAILKKRIIVCKWSSTAIIVFWIKKEKSWSISSYRNCGMRVGNVELRNSLIFLNISYRFVFVIYRLHN